MIKHSKYKNTALLYELLVSQIAADTFKEEKSPALKLLKKYFGANTLLAKELKLYNFIFKNTNVSENKAEVLLSTVTELSRKFNTKKLNEEKFNLVKDIKENYDIDVFFSRKVSLYKQMASMYNLMETYRSDKVVNPDFIVSNRTTILEYLTEKKFDPSEVEDKLIEEYSKFDKDLRLLTYKILLEKFNSKYKDFLPEQKEVIRTFIIDGNSVVKLRDYVNSKFEQVKKDLIESLSLVDDEIVKIKITEIASNINPISSQRRVDEDTLSNLLLYIELLSEIRNA